MTKIEEVARAIYDTAWYQGAYDIDKHTIDSWQIEEARQQARAAIEAMREPTEDMVLAGYETDDHVQGHDCRAIWRLMIDAALGVKR